MRGLGGRRAMASDRSWEGVEVRVARIFNSFGSRMHMNDGRVVSNFILQAPQGEPLTVSQGPATGSTCGEGHIQVTLCSPSLTVSSRYAHPERLI
ncbi:hypothetical protein AAFF_G00210060 [Aldrovandia affinis]|uniref:Uncharacterized protein n=1 Tax=Aldrovandia affinis TaxID=143900 RepID=A0AAD7WUZ8_9TELE|nr:hypothetical protein AAFF_G00210060 [Aldrovandia affinis]